MNKTSNKFFVEEGNSAEEETLGKKIKLEHEDISEKLHKKYLKIDVKEHEIQNFLLIIPLHSSTAYCTCERRRRKLIRGGRRHNRRNSSILLTLAQQISKVLNQDIDSLKFRRVIKKSLKTLKAIFGLFSTVKKDTKTVVKTDGEDQSNSQS